MSCGVGPAAATNARGAQIFLDSLSEYCDISPPVNACGQNSRAHGYPTSPANVQASCARAHSPARLTMAQRAHRRPRLVAAEDLSPTARPLRSRGVNQVDIAYERIEQMLVNCKL